MKFARLVALLFIVFGCASHPSVPTSEIIPEPSPTTLVGIGEEWRTAADNDSAGRATATPQPRLAPIVGGSVEPLARATSTQRTTAFEAISAETVNASPTVTMLKSDVGPTVVRAQVLLDRAHFSVGAIDGRAGKNTVLAIYWFQASQNLPVTGTLDSATYTRLASIAGTEDVITQHIIEDRHAAGPFGAIPRSVYEQEKMKCLCYGSRVEAIAERFHTTEEVLRKLNPKESFVSIAPGARIMVPSVEVPKDPELKPIARIHISKKGSYVHALAADGSIVYHFPSTLGSAYDPSPDGHFVVTGLAYNPTFKYDPTLFADIPDEKPKAKLPPGPNSPVGVVWIALSKEHVGIHGTPSPETIGTASSHGCVRLTNWDAVRLADATQKNIPVEFVT